MGQLIVERLLLGLLTLAAAAALVFAGTELLPGDLATALLQNNATPENIAAIRERFGLDRPAYERFFEWAGNALSFDFGTSLANQRPVAEEIGSRLGNTLFLAVYAAAVAVPLAILTGVLAAIYEGRFFDRMVNTVSLVSISLPEYCIAYLLITIFAVELRWLPSIANVNPGTTFGEQLVLLILPMVTLVMVVLAAMMRMTRASVLAIMSSPYIEMAYLKGLPRWRIVVTHALPNAWGPIISVVTLNLAYLVVGVVVVEFVYVYPGLGAKMVDSVSKRDIPMVQACGLIFATTFVSLNILADVLGILSNPRLRYRR